jgi:hypothetical protein
MLMEIFDSQQLRTISALRSKSMTLPQHRSALL